MSFEWALETIFILIAQGESIKVSHDQKIHLIFAEPEITGFQNQ